jgi:hypothetical protein
MINLPCLRSRCGISCVCPYENILTDSVEVVITNDFATAWPLALHGRHAENRVRLAGLERFSLRSANFANKTRHHSYTVNSNLHAGTGLIFLLFDINLVLNSLTLTLTLAITATQGFAIHRIQLCYKTFSDTASEL